MAVDSKTANSAETAITRIGFRANLREQAAETWS